MCQNVNRKNEMLSVDIWIITTSLAPRYCLRRGKDS